MARAQMVLGFEAAYGTPALRSFTLMAFASTMLGSEQPLLNSEILGTAGVPLAFAQQDQTTSQTSLPCLLACGARW